MSQEEETYYEGGATDTKTSREYLFKEIIRLKNWKEFKLIIFLSMTDSEDKLKGKMNEKKKNPDIN